MYYKLNKDDKKLLERVSNVTITDYDIKTILGSGVLTGEDEQEKEMFINTDNLIVALSDLLYEYNNLKEQYDDFKNEVEQYYEVKRDEK